MRALSTLRSEWLLVLCIHHTVNFPCPFKKRTLLILLIYLSIPITRGKREIYLFTNLHLENISHIVPARDSLSSLTLTIILWKMTLNEFQCLQGSPLRALSNIGIWQIPINYFERANWSKLLSSPLQIYSSSFKQVILKCLSKWQNNYYCLSSFLSLVQVTAYESITKKRVLHLMTFN